MEPEIAGEWSMPTRFEVHGKAHFVIGDQIVRLYVEGPWNKELVIETHGALTKELEGQPHRRWGMMVIVTKSATCGPDALQAIRDAGATETKMLGRTATAWVVAPEVEGRSMVAAIMDRAYSQVNAAMVFDTETAAEQWLVEELARPPEGTGQTPEDCC